MTVQLTKADAKKLLKIVEFSVSEASFEDETGVNYAVYSSDVLNFESLVKKLSKFAEVPYKRTTGLYNLDTDRWEK